MEKTKTLNISSRVKQLLSLRRTKVTVYMAVVLWLAVATQVAVNSLFKENFKITEAFVNTNTEETQSSIEIVAEYDKGFLSETDKEDVLKYLANAIGLKVDQEITAQIEDGRSEYSISKQAKSAMTEIKVISMEQEVEAAIEIKHYIMIRLSISQSIESIDKYKKMLEGALKDLEINDYQTTLQYTGSYEGVLTLEEKDKIVNQIVKELQGKIAYKYEKDELFTVYAYTGLLKEYIVTAGSKVNIQIAIAYDDLLNKTKVYLATPTLNQDW